jgi:hypothetical protein
MADLCFGAALAGASAQSARLRPAQGIRHAILFFVCAFSLVILASTEGLRIDNAGLRFEPRKILLADQETEIRKDRRVN